HSGEGSGRGQRLRPAHLSASRVAALPGRRAGDHSQVTTDSQINDIPHFEHSTQTLGIGSAIDSLCPLCDLAPSFRTEDEANPWTSYLSREKASGGPRCRILALIYCFLSWGACYFLPACGRRCSNRKTPCTPRCRDKCWPPVTGCSPFAMAGPILK